MSVEWKWPGLSFYQIKVVILAGPWKNIWVSWIYCVPEFSSHQFIFSCNVLKWGTHFITLLLYETLDSSSTQLWVDRHLVIELHLWFSAVNQKNLASRALGRMCSTEAACKKMACVFLSQTRLVHFICIACCLRLNSWQKTEFRGPVCRIDDKKIRCFFGIVAHCRAYFFINWISWSCFDTVTTKK